MKIIATVILSLGTTVGSLGIVSAVPASASSSRTYVYASGMGGLWRGPAIRPREIAFGALYDVESISWSKWSSSTAYGRGRYYGFGSYQANVKLYDVKIHRGRRYFSWIKITRRGHKTRYLNTQVATGTRDSISRHTSILCSQPYYLSAGPRSTMAMRSQSSM